MNFIKFSSGIDDIKLEKCVPFEWKRQKVNRFQITTGYWPPNSSEQKTQFIF